MGLCFTYRFAVKRLLAGLTREHLDDKRLLSTAVAGGAVRERLLGTAHEI